MTFTLLLIILLLTGSFLWIAVNLPHLVGFTASVLDWCQGVLTSCLSYVPIIKAGFIWAGIITVVMGVAYAVVMAALRLRKGHLAIKKLPVSHKEGMTIRLINDDSLNTAFTYGLIFPKIYVSSGLLKRLSRDEVHAVILHEMHHKKNRDPLRFFLFSILKDAFFYLPIGDYVKARLTYSRERAADDRAVHSTNDPYVLAGALLKVAGGDPMVDAAAIESASIKGVGSIEGRIRRLIGEGEGEGVATPSRKALLISLMVAVVLFVSAALPISAATVDPAKCDISHCAMHERTAHEKMGHEKEMSDDCKAHCELKH